MRIHLLASCVESEAQTYCGITSFKASLRWTIQDRQTGCPDCLFVRANPRYIGSYRAFHAQPAHRAA